MSLFNKALDEISKDDINELITEGVPEGIKIDYKENLFLNTRDQRKEFIKDIVAFANTNGGDLYYGVKEENTYPIEITGINIPNEDDFKQKVNNIIRDNIEPLLHGIGTHLVNIDTYRYILVIRVPKSWSSPHRSNLDNNFYARNRISSYPLDITEIKNKFTKDIDLMDKILEFRVGRIRNLISENLSVELKEGPVFLLHIIPMENFLYNQKFDLVGYNRLNISFLNGRNSSSWLYNYDGFMRYQTSSRTTKTTSYVQIFRNLSIEAAYVLDISDGNMVITPLHYQIEAFIRSKIELIIGNGINPPFLIAMSLLGVKGLGIHTSYEYTKKIKQDDLIIPPALLQDMRDIRELIRPSLNIIWQSAGLESAPNIEE